MNTSDTATELLDCAQSLVQQRGFNAFSYKDLAEAVGIRTASIHYHFKTKADLGQALMERYLAELNVALAHIDARGRTPKSKLKKFIDLYRVTEAGGAICLCGSLASDHGTLPEAVQIEVDAYLRRSEEWLVSKLEEGAEAGDFHLGSSARAHASTLLASLQGGLILTRARSGSLRVIDDVERSFFSTLEQ